MLKVLSWIFWSEVLCLRLCSLKGIPGVFRRPDSAVLLRWYVSLCSQTFGLGAAQLSVSSLRSKQYHSYGMYVALAFCFNAINSLNCESLILEVENQRKILVNQKMFYAFIYHIIIIISYYHPKMIEQLTDWVFNCAIKQGFVKVLMNEWDWKWPNLCILHKIALNSAFSFYLL